MLDFRLDRLEGYKVFHCLELATGDCDPAYPALRHIAAKKNLYVEQRYWLSWLYSLSYCGATAYYMFNEFPDYQDVTVRSLELWWAKNKSRCLFQTDRAKVKNFDKVVPMFDSYQKLCGGSQESAYSECRRNTPEETYQKVYSRMSQLYYFGRFSLFLLLEVVNELTGFPMIPTGLDLNNAKSCRNGLCYAAGKDNWVGRTLGDDQYAYLDKQLHGLLRQLKSEYPQFKHTFWNVETTLCAYKKLFPPFEKRYLGFYIDRMQSEILTMQKAVPELDWQALWDFRRAYFPTFMLGELNGWSGPRPGRAKMVRKTGRIFELDLPLRRLTHELG
jgi:hypothetical protein